MGCVRIDGVMYSLRPYKRGAFSRMPYPAAVEYLDFGTDSYRLTPVELRLKFDDEQQHTLTGKSCSTGCRVKQLSMQI